MPIKKTITYSITDGNLGWSFQDVDGLTLAEIQAKIGVAITDANYDAYSLAASDATTNYVGLPAFVKTMTADEAVTHIHTSILNGQTAAQLDAAIDAQILDITTASIAQINLRLAAIRGVLKTAAGAIIAMRDLFELIAKLLIYIRDLVIRFRSVVGVR